MSERENDPRNEGHTNEWQDRARVVLNAKENAQKDSVDKQSPLPGEGKDLDKDKNKRDRRESSHNDDPVY